MPRGRQTLRVREHKVLGPYVDGLSRLAVASYKVKTIHWTKKPFMHLCHRLPQTSTMQHCTTHPVSSVLQIFCDTWTEFLAAISSHRPLWLFISLEVPNVSSLTNQIKNGDNILLFYIVIFRRFNRTSYKL